MRVILILCAALGLAGCGATTSPLCLGVTKMTPQPATARYVAANDAPFGRQVATNNRVIGEACK